MEIPKKTDPLGICWSFMHPAPTAPGAPILLPFLGGEDFAPQRHELCELIHSLQE